MNSRDVGFLIAGAAAAVLVLRYIQSRGGKGCGCSG